MGITARLSTSLLKYLPTAASPSWTFRRRVRSDRPRDRLAFRPHRTRKRIIGRINCILRTYKNGKNGQFNLGANFSRNIDSNKNISKQRQQPATTTTTSNQQRQHFA